MTNTTTIYGVLPSQRIKDQISNANPSQSVKGVQFPLYDKDSGAKGIFAQTAGIDRLKGQITQLLGTGGEERLMLPNFGVNLEEFLFEPLTEELVIAIQTRIATAIYDYIPDVQIKDMQIKYLDEGSAFGIPGLRISLNVFSLEFQTDTEITVYHRP